MTEKLRVGVIGAGGISQMMHLPFLAERPDRFELVGLADVHEPTLATVAASYGARVATTDGMALAVHDDVDAVIIAASGLHRELCVAALAAGKHVLAEKPLCYTKAHVQQVADAAERASGILMVAYHKRYDPHYELARTLVQEMDDLRFVQVTVLHPEDGAYRLHHVVWPDPDGRGLPAEADDRAGALARVSDGPFADRMATLAGSAAHRVAALLATESLIHDINAVRGVLGEPEAVLSANVWQDGWAQTSSTRFAGDVVANLSWIAVPGLRNYEETVRFIGPRMRVTLTFPSPYLRHHPTSLVVERMAGGTWVREQHTVSYEEAFRVELDHFRRCALAGAPPRTGVSDALGDANWIEQIAAQY